MKGKELTNKEERDIILPLKKRMTKASGTLQGFWRLFCIIGNCLAFIRDAK